MASATTDGSHASNPLPRSVFPTEALGSALLCGGALLAGRVLGNATIDQEPLAFIVTALSQAMLALVTMAFLARTSGTLLTPNGAFVRAAHGALSPDDAACVIVAQLAGAAFAGILVGAIDRVPIPAVPDLWSRDNLRECVAAIALVVACRFAVRDRTQSPIIAAIVIVFAAIGGARFLGLPTVALANAFASVPDGGGIRVGTVLGAQTIGLVVGLLLPSFGEAHDVPTSVGRPS